MSAPSVGPGAPAPPARTAAATPRIASSTAAEARGRTTREYILAAMRVDRAIALAACLALAAGPATAGPARRSVAEARVRVAHHLDAVQSVAARLGTVLAAPCPAFASPGEWKKFEDREVDDVVLLMAHLEQAWIEAKAVKDDDLRRDAKAPRHRAEEGRRLVGKLEHCAAASHASFDPLAAWMRIQREVPRRQAEIALPE